MQIYRGLLKYGYSNFSLEILEYCNPSEVFSREQYYLDLLNPDYNILKIAGSHLGFKHSVAERETIAKFKGRKHSPETIAKMKTRIWTDEHRAKRLEHLQNLNSSKAQLERLFKFIASISQRVEVFDTLKKETTVYPSISEAARSIGCRNSSIVAALKDQKDRSPSEAASRLVKKRYFISLYNDKSQVAGSSMFSMGKNFKSYALRVEILDTLNGNSTVYLSIREAAAAIGSRTCNDP